MGLPDRDLVPYSVLLQAVPVAILHYLPVLLPTCIPPHTPPPPPPSTHPVLVRNSRPRYKHKPSQWLVCAYSWYSTQRNGATWPSLASDLHYEQVTGECPPLIKIKWLTNEMKTLPRRSTVYRYLEAATKLKQLLGWASHSNFKSRWSLVLTTLAMACAYLLCNCAFKLFMYHYLVGTVRIYLFTRPTSFALQPICLPTCLLHLSIEFTLLTFVLSFCVLYDWEFLDKI